MNTLNQISAPAHRPTDPNQPFHPTTTTKSTPYRTNAPFNAQLSPPARTRNT
jgi:hypothetical protein